MAMEQKSPTRRLTTVLAADVVSYSKMTARDEEHAVRLVRQRFATAATFVEQREGRVFNTAGDAFLAEFASPVEAVRCAVEIQEAMRTANQLADEVDRLQLRIGVNLGDVIVSGKDLLGDGVNVAARLESLAPAGGVCVSASVYEQLVGKLTLGAEDLGDQHVKNIPRPIRAYRLTPEGAPPAAAGAATPARRKIRLALPILAGLVVVGGAAVVATYWRSAPPPAAPTTTAAVAPSPVPAAATAPPPAVPAAAPPAAAQPAAAPPAASPGPPAQASSGHRRSGAHSPPRRSRSSTTPPRSGYGRPICPPWRARRWRSPRSATMAGRRSESTRRRRARKRWRPATLLSSG